jgi:hypothetical protein
MSEVFSRGTFSREGGAPFPGVVIREQVIPLRSVAGLTNADSILALLENWEANFAACGTPLRPLPAASRLRN